MSNKNIKLLFVIPLMLGTLLVVSSNSWLIAWVGLEINLMGFVPVMSNELSPASSEAPMKYFLAQSMGSMLFLFSAFTQTPLFSFFSMVPMTLLIFISLLIKMGAAPFHFWIPPVVSMMNIPQIVILLVWQKIGPLTLTSFFSINAILIPLIMTNIMGAVSGFNQNSLKKILTYSSISNNAWLILLIILNLNLGGLFFIIYALTIMALTLPLSHLISPSFMKFSNLPINIKISTMLNMFSLAGMPPLLGFIPKLAALMMMWKMNTSPLLPLSLIVSTLVSLFFYLRLTSISLIFPGSSPLNSAHAHPRSVGLALSSFTALGTLLVPLFTILL